MARLDRRGGLVRSAGGGSHLKMALLVSHWETGRVFDCDAPWMSQFRAKSWK